MEPRLGLSSSLENVTLAASVAVKLVARFRCGVCVLVSCLELKGFFNGFFIVLLWTVRESEVLLVLN